MWNTTSKEKHNTLAETGGVLEVILVEYLSVGQLSCDGPFILTPKQRDRCEARLYLLYCVRARRLKVNTDLINSCVGILRCDLCFLFFFHSPKIASKLRKQKIMFKKTRFWLS